MSFFGRHTLRSAEEMLIDQGKEGETMMAERVWMDVLYSTSAAAADYHLFCRRQHL
jgi:hypothetical protein